MVRSKYRYITLKIIPTKKNRSLFDVNFKNTDLYKTILSKVKKMHGDFGTSAVKTGLLCKYCNETTGVAILKMRHGPHRFVCTILPFITEIGKENIQLQTIRMTATLHQAYKYLKIYQQKELERIWHTISEDKQRETKLQYEDLKPIEELLLTEKQSSSKRTSVE